MNISIIGTGYVGLVTGLCLAELGSNVLCMDTDDEKINKLKNGESVIYEPGADELLKKNYLYTHRINFTNDIRNAVDFGEIIFIAVGTPPKMDDSADLQYVSQVAREIAHNMNEYKVIAIKSTVPVGTGKKIKQEIENILQKRNKHIEFDMVSNPEFLREGTAIKDFINTDRIVIGAESQKAFDYMKEIYNIQELMDIPMIETNIETAEFIKYASNTFLATKISFINEIANMCETYGADALVVAKSMGMDNRIGPQFLNPGPGYGGSCFPKDTKAMISIGKEIGYIPKIIKAAIYVNENQKRVMLKKIRNAIGNLKGKTISILGIAFKPNTDDIRESPSIGIIELLIKHNANIKVYDPQAMENLKKTYQELNIQYCSDAYQACIDSDAVVIMTEWEEFKNLNLNQLKAIMKSAIFLDLRNIYDPDEVKNQGFKYEGVGRK